MKTDSAPPGGGSPLQQLTMEGVSPWRQGITRDRPVEAPPAADVRGASTDLAAMARCLRDGDAYRAQLARLGRRGEGPDAALAALLAEDARRACDAFAPLFEATGGGDGHVSVDPGPLPPREPAAALHAARDLARRVDRPNLLVKLPATSAGLAAATCCLAEGIGVHVTGVYTERLHRRVLAAHLDGLERAAYAGVALPRVASVAALPLAALDREVDARLALSAPSGPPPASAALATAGLMYDQLDRQLDGGRWRALRRAGAHPQRLMWSDTGYARGGGGPTHYVQELVGWGTVALMTPPLLEAFALGGVLRGDTLSGRAGAARAVLAELEVRGVDLASAAQKLADDDDMRTRTTWLSLLSLVADGLGRR